MEFIKDLFLKLNSPRGPLGVEVMRHRRLRKEGTGKRDEISLIPMYGDAERLPLVLNTNGGALIYSIIAEAYILAAGGQVSKLSPVSSGGKNLPVWKKKIHSRIWIRAQFAKGPCQI